MQCGYCGTEIVEGEDFCKKCVEGYKIDNKKNTISGAKLKPRKPKPSGITPEKVANSPFAKMGLRMVGFIGGSIIMVFIITALIGGGSPAPQYVESCYGDCLGIDGYYP